MSYAPAQYWNRYFSKLHQSDQDLDWGTQWIENFLEPLHRANCQTILDLGCGTGNEVFSLTRKGFDVIGVDYSKVGVRHALTKTGSKAAFVVADMAQPLPFLTAKFDAVMSNVAAHMFSDKVTRGIFREIKRILQPNGLFLFHLNAIEDRPFRTRRKSEVQELEPNYILEGDGQTMHFFSVDYLQELLVGWGDVELELVEIPADLTKGYLPKWVWRGIVHCQK